MTVEAFRDRLVAYFPGRYNPARLEDIAAFARDIDDPDLDRLYRAIVESRTVNTPITLAEIKEACPGAGVTYRRAEYVEPMKVCCSACGEEYRYLPAPTDRQEVEERLYNRCPNCGFMHGWTLDAHAYLRHGVEQPWYDNLLAEFQGPAHPYGTGKGKGRWFNYSENKAWLQARDREERDRSIAIRDKLIGNVNSRNLSRAPYADG